MNIRILSSIPAFDRVMNISPNLHPNSLQSLHSPSYDEVYPYASPTTHFDGESNSKYHLNHVKDRVKGSF
jgi:hypothetical protein